MFGLRFLWFRVNVKAVIDFLPFSILSGDVLKWFGIVLGLDGIEFSFDCLDHPIVDVRVVCISISCRFGQNY